MKLTKNQQQRFEFVKKWAKYVKTHKDKDWSRQQNVIINSCLKNSTLTKEDFFKMKK